MRIRIRYRNIPQEMTQLTGYKRVSAFLAIAQMASYAARKPKFRTLCRFI